MKHFMEVDNIDTITSPMLAKNKSTFSEGDELVITVKDHREQVVLGISAVCREKVNKGWVYLGLTGIDDLAVLHKNDGQKDGSQ